MLTIFQAEKLEDVGGARELMLEYAMSLEFNLCFQGFEEEMRSCRKICATSRPASSCFVGKAARRLDSFTGVGSRWLV
jgi:hypothetical protein